jgi:Fic family protein
MSKLLFYGKIILVIMSITSVSFFMWQNTNLQNRINNAMEEIGNLSGALEIQNLTINQLNRQIIITQQNLRRFQEETTQIEINTIEELRNNRTVVNSAYTEDTQTSSELITNRTNEIFRNLGSR